MKCALISGFGCGTVLLIAGSSALAEVIVPTNPTSPVVTNSVQADGYYLFDTFPVGTASSTSADINELPTYASLTEEAPIYPPEDLSPDLTVNGTTYTGDGVAYANAGAEVNGVPGTGTPVEFATFKLGAGTPSDFQIGVLSNYPDATYFGLSLYSSDPNSGSPTPLSSVVIDPGQTSNPHQNQFYYADVVGATSGDYLVLDGYSSVDRSSQVTTGGVTFTAVPEPCTAGLMLLGVGAAGALARRRLAAV